MQTSQTRVVLGKLLGRGCQASVYQAVVNGTQLVVVKSYHSRTHPEAAAREATREVSAYLRIFGHDGADAFVPRMIFAHETHIGLELCPGGDLLSVAQQHGQMRDDEARVWVRSLLLALDFLHTTCHVAHLDVKLDNCLIDDRGRLRLADFGLAEVMDGVDGRCNKVCGSHPYASPEVVCREQGPYLARAADVWSAGICAYVLVAGVFPFRASLALKERFLLQMRERRSGVTEVLSADAVQKLGTSDLIPFLDACWDFDAERRPTAASLLPSVVAAHHAASSVATPVRTKRTHTTRSAPYDVVECRSSFHPCGGGSPSRSSDAQRARASSIVANAP